MTDVTYNTVGTNFLNASTVSIRALTVTSTFVNSYYDAFSIPWNAMQATGGIIVEDGLWIHKGLISTAQIRTSTFSASNATFNTLTTNSLNFLRFSTVYGETSNFSVKNSFDAANATIGSLTAESFTTNAFTVTDLTVTNLNASNQTFDAIKTPLLNLNDSNTNTDYPLTTSNSALIFNGNPLALVSYVNDLDANTNSRIAGVLGSNTATSNYFQDAITTLPNGLGDLGYVSTLTLDDRINNLGTLGYVSTQTLENALTSSITGLGDSGYVSTQTLTNTINNLGSIYVTTQTLTDTVTGLGTLGYVSSQTLSNELTNTVTGLGSLGYVSTQSLTSSLTGLGSLGYVSTQTLSNALTNTVTGLGSLGYVSTQSLTSSLTGLGSLGYVSTQTLSNELTNTVTGLGSLGYVSTQSLTSSLTGLGSLGYVSTQTLSNALTNTVTGLGSLGYISTQSLTSSLTGLGSLGYVSTQTLSNELTNTVTGLGSLGYISTQSLTSSLIGLGTLGYVSSQTLSNALTSSITGLGNAGYISTQTLTDTVTGLGTLGYVSTQTLSNALTNTVTGLGDAGYVSTLTLTSSLTGLGTLGYVSTQSLTSSLLGLSSSIFLNNIIQSTANISSFSTTAINLTPPSYITSSFLIGVGFTQADPSISIQTTDSLTTFTTASNTFTGRGISIDTDNNGLFVAGGSNAIDKPGESLKWSLDGKTWTPAFSGGFTSYANTVFYNGSNLWIAGGDSTGLHKYSGDGKNWSNATSQWTTNDPTIPFHVAHNGTNLYVATGLSNSSLTQCLQFSSDGTAWNSAITNSIRARGVAYGNNLWVACGDNIIGTSSDGSNWSVTATRATNTILNSCAFGNGTFIIVGKTPTGATSGSILYSTDGTNWTASVTGGGSNMFSVKYLGGSTFVAAGKNNSSSGSNIQYSTDNGSNWTGATTVGIFTSVYDIAGKYTSSISNPPSKLLPSPSGTLQFSTSILAYKSQTFAGNVKTVDSVYGNDSLAILDSSYPFATLSTAVEYLGPYQVLSINPGLYTLSKPLFLPSYASIKGSGQTYITFTNLTQATTLFTLGEYSKLDSLNISLITSSNLNFTGFAFPNSTNSTATVQNTTLTINNSSTDVTSDNNIKGVYITGSSISDPTFNTLDNVSLVLSGNGNGSVYGIQITNGTSFVNGVRVSIAVPSDNSSQGSNYGIVTNTGSITTKNTTILVSSNAGTYTAADLYSPSGTITLGTGTDLVVKNSGNAPFYTTTPLTQIHYLGLGALSNAPTTSYLLPGTVSTSLLSATPTYYFAEKNTILQSIVASLSAPPTGTNTTTLTICKNDIPTSVQIQFAGNQSTFRFYSTTSLALSTTDLLSLQVDRSGSSNSSTDLYTRLQLF